MADILRGDNSEEAFVHLVRKHAVSGVSGVVPKFLNTEIGRHTKGTLATDRYIIKGTMARCVGHDFKQITDRALQQGAELLDRRQLDARGRLLGQRGDGGPVEPGEAGNLTDPQATTGHQGGKMTEDHGAPPCALGVLRRIARHSSDADGHRASACRHGVRRGEATHSGVDRRRCQLFDAAHRRARFQRLDDRLATQVAVHPHQEHEFH